MTSLERSSSIPLWTLLGYFMWIISLLLSFPFQYLKTPVIFLDETHFLPLLSPIPQGFKIAREDALDAKPASVPTWKPESPSILHSHLAWLFLCLRSPLFLSSLKLLFLFSHLLLFVYSILSNNLHIWSISISAVSFTFIAIQLKMISLLLSHDSTHSRLDSVTKISPK